MVNSIRNMPSRQRIISKRQAALNEAAKRKKKEMRKENIKDGAAIAGLGCGWLIAVIVINLIFIAAVVFVIVKVLQAMGVL